jgi:hypothetical protein
MFNAEKTMYGTQERGAFPGRDGSPSRPAFSWRTPRRSGPTFGRIGGSAKLRPKQGYCRKSGCAGGICGYVTFVNWQQIISLAIVALAAGLLWRGRFRPRKFSFQRDTHCGCSAPEASPVQKSSIVFHARRGERRAVVVRMK